MGSYARLNYLRGYMMRWLVVLALCVMALAGCGPSSEEIGRLADERIKADGGSANADSSYLPPNTDTPADGHTHNVPAHSNAHNVPTHDVPTNAINSTPTPQPTPTPQLIVDFNAVQRQAWPSVFFIETAAGHGSGWLIEPGLILTNQHVVAWRASVTVRQSEDPSFAATVVAVAETSRY